MKKLIAIDLDGTLLSPFLSVSSFTKKVIKRLTYEGHVVVLASGRPYRAMKKLYEDFLFPLLLFVITEAMSSFLTSLHFLNLKEGFLLRL